MHPCHRLLHLVVSKSGAVSGYQYDFRHRLDAAAARSIGSGSQRMAWQVENDVMEAGLANLTEDLARALVFREDGWTQAWILMRISEPAAAEPTVQSSRRSEAVSRALVASPDDLDRLILASASGTG